MKININKDDLKICGLCNHSCYITSGEERILNCILHDKEVDIKDSCIEYKEF